MLITFNYFQAFVIGSCIGSFINVIVFRFPNNLSIVKPRSYCPKCKKRLAWKENIPLISWIIQRGKCKSCKASISSRYPLVELTTGCLFMIFLNSSPTTYDIGSILFLDVILSWIFLSLLICIALIDIDSFWIPQGLINFGFFIGFIGLILADFLSNNSITINLILRGVGASLMSFMIFELFRKIAKYIYKKDAIGKGDSKLIAMMALWLGPIGVILCVAISYILAAAFCLFGISLNFVKLKQVIPFAPFLSLGGLITWFLGNDFFINKLLLM